jgi:hypothetical protein
MIDFGKVGKIKFILFRKKIVFLYCFLLTLNPLFAVELYRDIGYSSAIEITDETLTYIDDIYDSDSKIEKYDIKSEIKYKILFITFNYTGNFLGDSVEHGIKEYLVLYDDYGAYLVFYDKNNNLVFSVSNKGSLNESYNDMAKADSDLKENETVYSASNIFSWGQLKPWVEGVAGSGIGQKIFIKGSNHSYTSVLSDTDNNKQV